jgi:hypothetical protein
MNESMIEYNLSKDYEKLKASFVPLENYCRELLQNHEVKTNYQLDELLSDWKEHVAARVHENVSPFPEFLTDHFSYNLVNSPVEDRHRDYIMNENDQEYFQKRIDERVRNLHILLDYLRFLSENQLEKPENVTSIQAKTDFILDKLYSVFNDNFYSIEFIFDLAGITHRSEESIELAEALQKKGYVTSKDYFSKSAFVKLTVKGAAYVERRNKTNLKKRAQKKEEELNKKVDIVLEKLQNLGYGQEIIFEEIEELKSLSGKLKKKTWIQLLKGKVIDLAMDQVINNETATYILETFSEEVSKLLPK